MTRQIANELANELIKFVSKQCQRGSFMYRALKERGIQLFIYFIWYCFEHLYTCKGQIGIKIGDIEPLEMLVPVDDGSVTDIGCNEINYAYYIRGGSQSTWDLNVWINREGFHISCKRWELLMYFNEFVRGIDACFNTATRTAVKFTTKFERRHYTLSFVPVQSTHGLYCALRAERAAAAPAALAVPSRKRARDDDDDDDDAIPSRARVSQSQPSPVAST